MKKFLISCLALLLFTPLGAREVTVSYYDYGRLHERSADGRRSGFGYDVLELLAKHAGWTNRYVAEGKGWSEAERMVASGEIEILDCVRKRPDREELYEFSAQPTGFSFANILIRKDDNRFDSRDCATWGRVKVGVVESDSVGREFKDYAALHGIAYDRRAYRTETDLVNALERREVDLAIVESIADMSNFRVLRSFNPRHYFFCTKKGDRALMEEINRAMSSMYKENPSWYIDLCKKYYPREDMVVYLPRYANDDGSHAKYLTSMADLLAAIGGVNPVFRECAPDFSDADFSIPCIVGHVHRTPENQAKFDFPFIPACRRPLCLAADPKDKRFAKGLPKHTVFNVGYDRSEKDWVESFLAYAREHGVAYRLVPFESMDALRKATLTDVIDLALVGVDKRTDLAPVVSCGAEEFDFATPRTQPAFRETLDMCVRYVRYHEGPFIRAIERYAFGIEDNSRTVRAGVYVESGSVEMAADGSLHGYTIEYLREVARVAGWDLVFVPMPYPDAVEALAAGEIDLLGVSGGRPLLSSRFDTSYRDAGVVRYALKVKEDSPLIPNRPDLWKGNRIGYLDGSLPVAELKNYLDAIGADYRLVPYDRLAKAHDDVRDGRLDGIFTVHANESRQYRTIAVFPLVHLFFCTSRYRPDVKKDIDAAMDYFSSHNMDFNWWLNNYYLHTSREQLTFDAGEIDFVRRHRGRQIVVSFTEGVAPVIEVDGDEVSGFLPSLFRLLDEKSDLDFRFVSEGKADVYVFHTATGGSEDRIELRNWFPLPTVSVSLPEDLVPRAARGIWAVEEKRKDEIEYLKSRNRQVLLCPNRIECYRAVAKGLAEATIDNLGSARLMIDENREFRKLRDSRIDSNEFARHVTIAFPSDGEPELPRIFKKLRSSITDSAAERLFLDAIIASRHGRFNVEDLIYYGIPVVCAVLLVIVVILLVSNHRIRRERSEKEFNAAASKAKTTFLFNMSHDIRTPMNAIRGFTDIAKENLDDRERLIDCLFKIDHSTELLLSLINSVLDMSRIESGKMKLDETEGDVTMSFVNIESTMQQLAKSRNITLTFSVDEIPDRYVYIDHDRFSRVLVNLISNAIKYTNPGGIVRVKCAEVSRGLYRYTISDNGIGMSSEFQKHVFEEFSRERNSTASGVQGTGLGLALTKSFVELMGGHIAYRSKQGVGTTFVVTVPFRINEEVRVKSEEVANESAGKGPASSTLHSSLSTLPSKKVLLVEDNALNREVAEYLLKKNGFEVENAENGSSAVALVREKGVDYYAAILMDIQMPIMNGYDATRAIRELEKGTPGHHLPIIALSANAFAEDRAASVAAGMDAHVAKPIKVKELLAVLAKFLG